MSAKNQEARAVHNNSVSFTPALRSGVEILLLARLLHTSAPSYTADTTKAAASLCSKLGDGEWHGEVIWTLPFLQTLGCSKSPCRKGCPDLLGVDRALTRPTCHVRERQRLMLTCLTKFVGTNGLHNKIVCVAQAPSKRLRVLGMNVLWKA